MKFHISTKPSIVFQPEETRDGEFNSVRVAITRATLIGESLKLWIRDANDAKTIQVQIEVADLHQFETLFAAVRAARGEMRR